ncbi:MAG: cupredoxin domain-containing protein [Alphaproteobacteria bacterium]|nr:cupredoxin domain-containing protein [Alphaproteobacteria bacterium]
MIVRMLALLVALTSAASAHVQLVSVMMINSTCRPTTLDLLAGSDYQLHILNAESGARDFSAPDLFAAGVVAPGDAAKVKEGAVTINGGATVDLRFTPGKRGTYKLTCARIPGLVTVE